MDSTAVLPGFGTSSRRPPRRPAALLVMSGADQGRVVAIPDEGLRIGRSRECELQLGAANEGTSRFHARIKPSGARVAVEDLGSRNGLLINGVRCRLGLLWDGDVLKMGRAIVKALADPEDIAFYSDRYEARQAASSSLGLPPAIDTPHWEPAPSLRNGSAPAS